MVHFNLFFTCVCWLHFLSERNCETLPLLLALNCSLDCSSDCLLLKLSLKWYTGKKTFVMVGGSEIFSVIFIVAINNSLKLSIQLNTSSFCSPLKQW